MQPLFQQARGLGLRAFLLIVLSVGLMVVDHREQHLEQFRSLLLSAIAPLQYAVHAPTRLADWTTEGLGSREDLREAVTRLERDNLHLRVRQQQFETLSAENERLRELLDASARREERVLVAELLAVDLDPFRQQVVINQGRNAGVYRGQPVIDAFGVMGQVVHVGHFTAHVLLISDANHALPVQINRTGLRTIAAGIGEAERISLLYIPNNADIEVEDIVVTSGLGGRFPPNYPVARVIEVERRPGEAFARVLARPMARLDRSREVLVVWPDEDGQAARATAAGDAAAPARVDDDPAVETEAEP